VQVYAVEYRLAPEWRFPTQLDEYVAVAEWLHGDGGKARGVSKKKVMGGGDSAGGNMAAAVSLRLRDEGKQNPSAQILLYLEARLPFDTQAAAENNSGLYLECKPQPPDSCGTIAEYDLGNGIFSFADHYLPRGTAPSHPYVSPGMQSNDFLKNVPPSAVFTCGFDPLRDVGVEYGTRLKQAGNDVQWHHFDTLTHGFLQLAPWSKEAMKATKLVGSEVKRLAYS
jgi:acetyl esterase/lipase